MNPSRKYDRLPRRDIDPYPVNSQVHIPSQIGVIDSDERNTCPYGWLFSVGACVVSLCTLIVLVIFFIWMATKGVTLN